MGQVASIKRDDDDDDDDSKLWHFVTVLIRYAARH